MDVRLDVHRGEYDPERDHLRLKVWKVPQSNENNGDWFMNTWSADSARDQTMMLNSEAILPRANNNLILDLEFEDDSDVFLDGGGDRGKPSRAQDSQKRNADYIQELRAESLLAGNPDMPIRLVAVIDDLDAGLIATWRAAAWRPSGSTSCSAVSRRWRRVWSPTRRCRCRR